MQDLKLIFNDSQTRYFLGPLSGRSSIELASTSIDWCPTSKIFKMIDLTKIGSYMIGYLYICIQKSIIYSLGFTSAKNFRRNHIPIHQRTIYKYLENKKKHEHSSQATKNFKN